MLNTLLGLFLLIIFYFGAYKLVKDHSRINSFFIVVLINLVIMLILYVSGLIGLLRPAVGVIGLIGILYFIISILKNWNLVNSDVKKIIILWLGTFKKLFNINSIFQALIVVIVSASSSFALINMTINIWAYDKTWMLILVTFMTILIYPILYNHVIHSLLLIKKDRIYRYLSILIFILSIIFFGLFLRGNEFLVPRTDSITIQNIGTKNAFTDRSEIILVEVKEKSTQAILEFEPNSNWENVNIADNTKGIISKNRNDPLLYKYSDKGPSPYEFIFLGTPKSGVVEISINRDATTYNLYDQSINQKLIKLNSNYYPSDILILCANLLFSITLLQILFKYIYLSQAVQERSFLSEINKYFFFLFLVIVLFLFTRPMHFYVFDEFTHWGTFIKELSIKNQLPMENFCTAFPNYIPGISLFEYFFTTFLGFKEGHAYFAYLFFIFSEVWIVFMDVPPQKIFLRIIYLLTIIISLFFLPLTFISLYVDIPLGLLFGVGLIYYYKYRDTSFYEAVIFLIFCGLQLMKTWGLVFSIMLFGIIFIDKIYSQTQEKKKRKFSHKKELFFLTLILLSSILLIQIPWQIYMQKNGIAGSLQKNGIAGSLNDKEVLVNLLQNGTGLDTNTLFNRWVDITIKGRQGSVLHGVLSIFNLSLLLLSVSIMISFNKKQILRFNLSIYLFFIIDIFLLFFAYVFHFTFTIDEAVRLASYERYVSEFFAGWFLFLIYQISTCFSLGNCSQKFSKFVHICLIAMIVLFLPEMNKLIHVPPQNYLGRRETLRYILEKDKDALFDGKYNRIFHIAQNTNGIAHYTLRYEICPNTAQINGWSFGEPYPVLESNCITIPYKSDELSTLITSDYDYVLITEPDKQLWQKYGDIFQEHRLDGDQLFKVNNGQIILIE